MEEYCDSHYLKACHQLTYFEIIRPVPDLSMAEIHEDPKNVMLPPPLRRLPGRPRKNRRRKSSEGALGPGVTKRSITIRCDTCKRFSHNNRKCQRALVAATRSNSRSSKVTAT